MEKDHSHLYEVPIEHLDLSVISINALKRSGVTTIGDCVDFWQRAIGGTVGCCHPSFLKAMGVEVREKMVKHGYWSYVEYDE